MRTRTALRFLAAVGASVVLFSCASAFAQASRCDPAWTEIGSSAGSSASIAGQVRSLALWDPDADGPLSNHLVVGGQFSNAGGTAAQNIALLNLESGSWSTLGPGLPGAVTSLATLPDGSLVASGAFYVFETRAANIARWVGGQWSPLSDGLSGAALALAVSPDGDLIAGGRFSHAGSMFVGRVARWDGQSWSAIGGGVSQGFDTSVRSIAFAPNSDLIVGGSFLMAGGAPARNIARWNGATWSALGAGCPSEVNAVVTDPSGIVFVGGNFLDTSSFEHVRRWDGTAWSPITWGTESPNGYVAAMAVLPEGDLIIGGALRSGTRYLSAMRWNGNSWYDMGYNDLGRPSVFLNAPVMPIVGGFANATSSRLFRWTSPCTCPTDLDNDGHLPNGGTRDGAVTIDDMLFFVTAYGSANLAADLDDDGEPTAANPDGGVDINDLLFFLAHFEAGC